MTTEHNASTTLDDDCITCAPESYWARLRELLASAVNSKDLLRLLYWRVRGEDWERNEAHQLSRFIAVLERTGKLVELQARLREALEDVVSAE